MNPTIPHMIAWSMLRNERAASIVNTTEHPDQVLRGDAWNPQPRDHFHRIQKRLLANHMRWIDVISENAGQLVIKHICNRISEQVEILLTQTKRLAILKIGPRIENCSRRLRRSEQWDFIHTATVYDRAMIERCLRQRRRAVKITKFAREPIDAIKLMRCLKGTEVWSSKTARCSADNCRDSIMPATDIAFNLVDVKLVVESDWDVTVVTPLGMWSMAMI